MVVGKGTRKLLLLIHILTSVGMMGSVAGFLVLAIIGLNDPARGPAVYPAMDLLTRMLIVPLAVTSLSVGTFQALMTPWGLFQHYWVVIKLVLTIIVLLVLLIQVPNINLLAGVDPATMASPEWARTRFSMVLHAAGGMAVLLVALVLSVYKPKGLTRYGWNRRASAIRETSS